MKEQLSVLLVEDDPDACKKLEQYIDTQKDICLAGVTNNSAEAIIYTKRYLPDAIILDLELHQGRGNGILFLTELNKLGLSFLPYILVTTNNSSTLTYDYVHQCGADFIMSKHQEDYSAKSVINFLQMMKSTIHRKRNNKDYQSQTTESPDQKSKRIRRRICLELDLIGISPKVIGYKYLIDAIEITIEDPAKNLCSIIAPKYQKTDSSVERAMQNAITKAWRSSDIDDLTKHYTAKVSPHKGVPTISEFIFYYANKIKNEY